MGDSIGNLTRGLMVLGSALVLAACGGGGGGSSSGGGANVPENSYRVNTSASRTQLPLNLNPDPCVNRPNPWAPNAATVFVQAERRLTGTPIPGGDNVFACNVASGLESGALYYFRGSDEERVKVQCGEDELEVEKSFRSITLGANAGGASFHVLSTNVVGAVVVRCVATDPVSGSTATGEFTIQVGGASSGRASQVAYSTEGPNWLFVQGFGGPTQQVYQVRVVDEAGQAVPNPPAGTANLLARIVPNPASSADHDALLRAGDQSSKSVAVSTINGQAQFTVVSGSSPGSIGVEFIADRADGNVQNGIGEPIRNAVQVPVVNALPGPPLVLVTDKLADAFLGTPYAQFIEASGGVLPRTFGLGQGTSLPAGLTLTPDGVIIGTPTSAGDNRSFIIDVTDASGLTVRRAFTMNVKATGGAALAVSTATLPGATENTPYTALLEATGGVPPYSWSGVGTTAPFTVGGTGFGTVTGRPSLGDAGSRTIVVQVQDANGNTAPRAFSITIAPAPAAP